MAVARGAQRSPCTLEASSYRDTASAEWLFVVGKQPGLIPISGLIAERELSLPVYILPLTPRHYSSNEVSAATEPRDHYRVKELSFNRVKDGLRSLKCQVAFLESAHGDQSTTFYHNHQLVCRVHVTVLLCVCCSAAPTEAFGINESENASLPKLP